MQFADAVEQLGSWLIMDACQIGSIEGYTGRQVLWKIKTNMDFHVAKAQECADLIRFIVWNEGSLDH
jgi:hypothetical protein